MPKWIVLLCLYVAATPAFVMAASAQPSEIEGLWQQVETTAGSCPTCRIEIARGGDSLIVTASNGWSAVVGSGGDIESAGAGVWLTGKRGWVSGRRFDLTLRLLDQRLHMNMSVEMADGSRRVIKAVFERLWLGA